MISKGIELVITAKNAMATGIASAGNSIKGLAPMLRSFTKLALGPIAAVTAAWYAGARAVEFVNDLIQAQGKRYRELDAANAEQKIDAIAKAQGRLQKETAAATAAAQAQRKILAESADAAEELASAQARLAKSKAIGALDPADTEGRAFLEKQISDQQELEAAAKRVTDAIRKQQAAQEDAPRNLAAANEAKDLAAAAREAFERENDAALAYVKKSNDARLASNKEMYAAEAKAAGDRAAKALAQYQSLLEEERAFTQKVVDYAKTNQTALREIEIAKTEFAAKQLDIQTRNAESAYKAQKDFEDEAAKDQATANEELAKAEKDRARAIEDAANAQRRANEDRIDALEKILRTTKEIADASIEDIMASKRAAEEKKKQEADERRRAQDVADRLAGGKQKRLGGTERAEVRRIGDKKQDDESLRKIGDRRTSDESGVRRIGETLDAVGKDDREFLKTFNERQKARSFADEKLKNIEKLLDDNLKLG